MDFSAMVATPAFAEKIKACEFKKNQTNSLIESADSGFALLYGVYTFLYQDTIIDTNEKFSLCANACVCLYIYVCVCVIPPSSCGTNVWSEVSLW